MSEEIIIDGVKVAECQYFNKVYNEEPYCNIDEEHLYTCSSEPNCYFKQLQRLKQENEELKYENDRQKETIIYLKNYDMCHKTLIQYKQALEEIKKFLLDYCSDCVESCSDCLIDKSLFKIKEVLNEK